MDAAGGWSERHARRFTPAEPGPAEPPPAAGLTAEAAGEAPAGHAGGGGRLAELAASPLAAFVSQVGVLTAVLFYFGWVRARATYGYFGVDVSVLDFSVSDYVVRSVSTVGPLIAAIGFFAVGAFLARDWLRPALGSAGEAVAARAAPVLGGAGAFLVAAGFVLALTVHGNGGPAIWGPGIMLLGFAAGCYALVLRDSRPGRRRSRLIPVMLSMLLLIFLWAITSYADYVGVQTARQVQAGLRRQADVVIYSAGNLALSGPGITVAPARAPGGPYRFRYGGLRLLISSGGQYFLLPAGWRPGDGSVFVLPAAPDGGAASMRVEFRAP